MPLGRLMEREKMEECANKVSDSVDIMCEMVERLKECKGVNVMNVAKSKSVPKSYAVIVKGANEDLTAREVKRRMNEAIVDEVDVRVKKVRPAKDGVIVEMASDKEKGILTTCLNFRESAERNDGE